MVCEQLGQEPDPEKMPLSPLDFPSEVQVAFFVYDMLTSQYAGMDGIFVGKNFDTCNLIFETFEVEDRPTILLIMKIYENIIVSYQAKERQKEADKIKRKQEMNTPKNGQTVHSVRGS